MNIQNGYEFELNSVNYVEVDRHTQTRIKIRIPKNLHDEPVISSTLR